MISFNSLSRIEAILKRMLPDSSMGPLDACVCASDGETMGMFHRLTNQVACELSDPASATEEVITACAAGMITGMLADGEIKKPDGFPEVARAAKLFQVSHVEHVLLRRIPDRMGLFDVQMPMWDGKQTVTFHRLSLQVSEFIYTKEHTSFATEELILAAARRILGMTTAELIEIMEGGVGRFAPTPEVHTPERPRRKFDL